VTSEEREVRTRAAFVFAGETVERWMTAANQYLGGRAPVHVLREGRADLVHDLLGLMEAHAVPRSAPLGQRASEGRGS
jgi:hypothetical protein